MFSFLVLSSEFHSLLLENGMASNDSGAIALLMVMMVDNE